MDNIIERIIDIENKANAISDSAHEYTKHLDEHIKEETEKIEKELDAKTESAAEKIREAEKETAETTVKTIYETCGKYLAEMEREFTEHRAEWTETLFNRIINGAE